MVKKMTNLKEKTNEELARTALNCLEELEFRGNKAIKKARQDVAIFHYGILALQSMLKAREIELLEEIWGEEMEHSRND